MTESVIDLALEFMAQQGFGVEEARAELAQLRRKADALDKLERICNHGIQTTGWESFGVGLNILESEVWEVLDEEHAKPIGYGLTLVAAIEAAEVTG